MERNEYIIGREFQSFMVEGMKDTDEAWVLQKGGLRVRGGSNERRE